MLSICHPWVKTKALQSGLTQVPSPIPGTEGLTSGHTCNLFLVLPRGRAWGARDHRRRRLWLWTSGCPGQVHPSGAESLAPGSRGLCVPLQVLEESKCLVRSFLKSVLEDVNEKECVMLKQLWSSSKGLDSLFSYLQDKIYEV